MRKVLRFSKERKGQSIAEFALILPIIVMLIGIIISGGHALYAKLALQIATYEGARAAITETNFSDATKEANSVIKKHMQGNPMLNGATTIRTSTKNGWVKGEPLTVETSYTFKTLFPVPGTSWDKSGTTVTLHSRIEMAIENQP